MAAGHPNVPPYDVQLVTDHGRLQSDSHRIKTSLVKKKRGIDPLKDHPSKIQRLAPRIAAAILKPTSPPVVLRRSSLLKSLIIINHNNLKEVLIVY